MIRRRGVHLVATEPSARVGPPATQAGCSPSSCCRRRPGGDLSNARKAASYDTVVCSTAFARAEFDRIGARNVRQIRLGVDRSPFRHLAALPPTTQPSHQLPGDRKSCVVSWDEGQSR
jgi:hypothetical protein